MKQKEIESTPIAVSAVAVTDVGRVRTLNEDRVLAFVRAAEQGDAAALLVVADGMGGHSAGEVASTLAVDTLKESLSWLIDAPEHDYAPIAQMLSSAFLDYSATYEPQTNQPYIEKHLCMAISQANQSIYTYSQAHPTAAGNLGTTLACAVVIGKQLLTAHVGDSRIYLLRNGIVTQLTDDHSFVGLLIRMGELTEEEAHSHPQRNFVTRSLGQKLDVEIEVAMHDLQVGDRLMVCSDGFWDYAEKGWERYVGLPELDKAAQKLVDLANSGGGRDNISVVLADLVTVEPTAEPMPLTGVASLRQRVATTRE